MTICFSTFCILFQSSLFRPQPYSLRPRHSLLSCRSEASWWPARCLQNGKAVEVTGGHRRPKKKRLGKRDLWFFGVSNFSPNWPCSAKHSTPCCKTPIAACLKGHMDGPATVQIPEWLSLALRFSKRGTQDPPCWGTCWLGWLLGWWVGLGWLLACLAGCLVAYLLVFM